MIRGFYAAATAMDAAEKQQDVASYNVSHATTPGFLQRGLTFETFDRVLGRDNTPVGDLTGTRLSGSYTDFRPGSMTKTDNPYDLALDGDSFFAINTPNGVLYTRNGSFRLLTENQAAIIVTNEGHSLRGTAANPTIQIPANSLRVSIASDGTVSADENIIGQVERVRFTNPRNLEPVGTTLFRAAPGSGMTPSNARVFQGYRETSNVQPSQAVVQMMLSLRYFEATQRAMRAIADSIGLNTKPQ